MADEILCTIDDHIATITLNRPEKRNALNSAALRALSATVAGLEDRPDVRVVVIRGAGKAFSSGAICAKWASNRRPEAGRSQHCRGVSPHRSPTSSHHCYGAGRCPGRGCELALHCDLRLAAETARFGMPLARLGLVVPLS